MKVPNKIQISLFLLSILIVLFQLYLIFYSSERWFQPFGYQFILARISILYFFIQISFVFICKTLKSSYYTEIVKVSVFSSVILLMVVFLFQISLIKLPVSLQMQLDINYKAMLKEDSLQQVQKLESLNTILKTDTTNFEAYMQRGSIFKAKNKWHDALEDFKKAYKINPENFEVNLEMGDCMRTLGDSLAMADFYTKACQINPESNVLRINPYSPFRNNNKLRKPNKSNKKKSQSYPQK